MSPPSCAEIATCDCIQERSTSYRMDDAVVMQCQRCGHLSVFESQDPEETQQEEEDAADTRFLNRVVVVVLAGCAFFTFLLILSAIHSKVH